MSSDDGKKQNPSEQDLIKELAAILTDNAPSESKPSGKPASKSAAPSKSGGSRIDHDLIHELSSLLTETGLTEIEIDQNGLRVRVARNAGVPTVGVAAPAPVAAAPAPAESAAPAAESHVGAVASPMVGTAYLSPEPGAAPFVQVGDSVREGQTLMIVEAMKTMNPIPAPKAGKVTRILVDDGQPVEYGEVLMAIE